MKNSTAKKIVDVAALPANKELNFLLRGTKIHNKSSVTLLRPVTHPPTEQSQAFVKRVPSLTDLHVQKPGINAVKPSRRVGCSVS